MRARIGEIIQLAGLVVTGAGVGIELALKADVGFIYITIGSILFAIGCKLKGR